MALTFTVAAWLNALVAVWFASAAGVAVFALREPVEPGPDAPAAARDVWMGAGTMLAFCALAVAGFGARAISAAAGGG